MHRTGERRCAKNARQQKCEQPQQQLLIVESGLVSMRLLLCTLLRHCSAWQATHNCPRLLPEKECPKNDELSSVESSRGSATGLPAAARPALASTCSGKRARPSHTPSKWSTATTAHPQPPTRFVTSQKYTFGQMLCHLFSFRCSTLQPIGVSV